MKQIILFSLISSLLFLMLVYLGMHYHWVDVLNSNDNDQTILPIPPIQPSANKLNSSSDEEGVGQTLPHFKPVIIPADQNKSLLATLTKGQISQHCLSIFNKLHNTRDTQELFIADCVLSNYKEPIQTYQEDQTSAQNQLDQSIRKKCQMSSGSNTDKLSFVEKELLVGMCLSNSASYQKE